MKAAQNALLRKTVVILNERSMLACCVIKSPLTEAFIEITAFITEHFGLDQKDFWQTGWGDFQGSPLLFSKPRRY